MRCRLAVVCFLIIGNILYAQKIRYNTQACSLSVEDKSKIQAVAEFEAAYFTEVFGAKKRPTVYVNVYGERRLYNRKNPPNGSQGFYRSGSKAVYVLYSSAYLYTCYHELSHATFDAFARNKPTWLDEGIATYFESSRVDSTGRVEIFIPKSRKADMQKMAQSGNLNMSTLLNKSYKRFHLWRENRNYTMSWGIVNYFMAKHREMFGTILYRIGTSTDSVKAINDEYPGGVAQLEKDIVGFYK